MHLVEEALAVGHVVAADLDGGDVGEQADERLRVEGGGPTKLWVLVQLERIPGRNNFGNTFVKNLS